MRTIGRHAVVTVALGLLPWAGSADPAAPCRVKALFLDYPGSEGGMPAHLYLPDCGSRHSGVLVLHTSAGPGANVETFARRLAAEGFVAMTPDLFALHDFGSEGRADHPLVLEDLEGALAFLKAHPAVDASRIGVAGFSYGGRLAVIAAATHPELRAAVVYYAVSSYQALAQERPIGGRALRTRPTTELATAIGAPVLIHHGEADRTVPPSQARAFHDALIAAGKSSTLHLYPSAAHLFNFAGEGDDPGAYQAEAARVSWERSLSFLKRHLGRRPASPTSP